MKAMPAQPAADAASVPGRSARKVADGRDGRSGTDFTQVLRRQEDPGKRPPAAAGETDTGRNAAPPAENAKGRGTPSVADPAFSITLDGAGELPVAEISAHGRRMAERKEKGTDFPLSIGFAEEMAVPASLSAPPQQTVPAAMMRNAGAAAREARVVDGRSLPPLEGMADADGAAVADALPEISPDAEMRMDHAETALRRGRPHEGRGLGTDSFSGDERMPMKVVSVSSERHLEPAGTSPAGARDGMWRGAAAQVLRALDEGLVPQALSGLDGGRSGGPKVIRNLEIQLHPASLGTVTARLSISGGDMEITISVPDRRLADQMERGLDQLVRRIRARDHGSGRTVVHLVTEPQNQLGDRFQPQPQGQPVADGRSSFGAQTREGGASGGHAGREGHASAQAHDGGGAGDDGTRNSEAVRRAARRDGLLYL